MNARICRDPRGAGTELQLPRTVLQHRRLGVIAELHAFLAAEGIAPATAAGWSTDSLGFATHQPEPGR